MNYVNELQDFVISIGRLLIFLLFLYLCTFSLTNKNNTYFAQTITRNFRFTAMYTYSSTRYAVHPDESKKYNTIKLGELFKPVSFKWGLPNYKMVGFGTLCPHMPITGEWKIIFNFDLPAHQEVHHFMGEAERTRHIFVYNKHAVVTPCSIPIGAGTSNYSFVWGMARENLNYGDRIRFYPQLLHNWVITR